MSSNADGVTAQVRMDPPNLLSQLHPTAATFYDKMDFGLPYITTRTYLKIKFIFKDIAAL